MWDESPFAAASCLKQQRQFGREGSGDSKAVLGILVLPGGKNRLDVLQL